jgi:Domain of unknown function (DUF4287)/Activator of Hsp90 ATPase homolog 1-like protein
MPTESTNKKTNAPRMSDEAVKAKTGKDWKQWFAILDKAGARKMTHQEIVAVLNSKHGVGPWWGQMVTVTYEQARGLRDKHEKPGGYEISVSRTLNVPVSAVFRSFADEKQRGGWLGENGLVVRKVTPNKTMRVTWKDGKTSLNISFLPKDANKSQVVVQLNKLSDAKSAEKMKSYWSRKLDSLKDALN